MMASITISLTSSFRSAADNLKDEQADEEHGGVEQAPLQLSTRSHSSDLRRGQPKKLPEYTWLCLISALPEASFDLIGDDRQLSPYAFDAKTAITTVSAASALATATKMNGCEVVRFNEVYRAPSCRRPLAPEDRSRRGWPHARRFFVYCSL